VQSDARQTAHLNVVAYRFRRQSLERLSPFGGRVCICIVGGKFGGVSVGEAVYPFSVTETPLGCHETPLRCHCWIVQQRAPIRWQHRYSLRSALRLAGFKCRWSKVDRSRSRRVLALLAAGPIASSIFKACRQTGTAGQASKQWHPAIYRVLTVAPCDLPCSGNLSI